MTASELWQRHREHLCRVPALGLTLDVSRRRFDDEFLKGMEIPMQRAFAAMDALERGAIANPDQKRRVGHYWPRAPGLAPKPDLTAEIKRTIADIKKFVGDVPPLEQAALRTFPSP
jgi:glucose-6-phosphate isomerase